MDSEYWDSRMEDIAVELGDVATFRAFKKFHQAHPAVYARLVLKARRLVQRGVCSGVSMRMLVEVLRWEDMMRDAPPAAINNNWTPYYARLIEFRVPELRGIFSKRKSHADHASLLGVQGSTDADAYRRRKG